MVNGTVYLMLLSEAFDQYRRDVILFRNQSRKTEENHLIAKRSLIKFMGDIDVRDLNFERVRLWKEHLEKGRSAETVRNYIIKLRVVLSYLKKRGDKCLDPDLLPVPQRTDKVPEFITKDDVAKLISATTKIRNKALISLLYASGVRVSECCRLNRADIKGNTFTVVGKGGKARLCFLDERTQVLLELYLQSRTDNNQALFTGKFANHRITAGNIQEIFRYTRRAAGFSQPIHPHTLRHSFATDLLRNNANIRYVQSLLGHASLETTQMYTHVVDEDLRKIYSKHHTI